MTANRRQEHTARIVGRTLRLVLGVALVWMTYTVGRAGTSAFNLGVAALVVGLTAFYAVVHVVANRYFARVNPWLGAVLAVAPVILVYILGGSLGRVASVAYIGISLVLQGVRGDRGCEVMAIPTILIGRRTHLVCIVFSPIDWLENRVAEGADAD